MSERVRVFSMLVAELLTSVWCTALLKARFPSLPVYSYAGFGNANGYNANVWPLIKSASDGCPGHQPCRKIAEPYADWCVTFALLVLRYSRPTNFG